MDEETIKKAKQQYEVCDATGKAALEAVFGKELFTSDMPTSFEQACEFNGTSPEKVIPFKNPENADEEAVNSFARLIQTSRAIKKGKKLDYTNENQKKYFNVYDLRAGFGFFFASYDWTLTGTAVGPRLSFFNPEEAQHSEKYFHEDYKKMIVE